MSRSGPWPRNTWDGCLASCRLPGRCRLCRDHADPLLRPRGEVELDLARGLREHGVIVAEARPGTGDERHPALPDDDRAGRHELAVPGLYSESLADAVAAVLDRAAGL